MSTAPRITLAAGRRLGVMSILAASVIACSSSAGGSPAAGSAAPAITPSAVASAEVSAAPSPTASASAPAASEAPSEAAGPASDPICDVWLSPAAVESVLGAPPTRITGDMRNMGLPGMPEAPSCQWATGGRGTVTMDVQYDGDNSYVAGKILAIGEEVKGVGDVAGFLDSDGGILYIAVGDDPSAIITLRGDKAGQALTKDELIALGTQLTVPPPPAS